MKIELLFEEIIGLIEGREVSIKEYDTNKTIIIHKPEDITPKELLEGIHNEFFEMKEYSFSYRGEFNIIVKAKNEDEAIKKALDGKGEISLEGDLWEEYLTLTEE